MFLLGKFVQVLSVPAMIVISILTGLYILESKDLVAKEYELISLISKISYIFYLVQFPVIYIINQLSNFNTNITISIEVLITFLISIILTFALNVSKEKVSI